MIIRQNVTKKYCEPYNFKICALPRFAPLDPAVETPRYIQRSVVAHRYWTADKYVRQPHGIRDDGQTGANEDQPGRHLKRYRQQCDSDAQECRENNVYDHDPLF